MVVLSVLALSACHHHDNFYDPPMPDLPPVQASERPIDPASLTTPRWDAVLVAGDTLLHAHDDAVAELQHHLENSDIPIERLRGFSADQQVYVGGVEGLGVRGDDDLSRSARRGDQSDDADEPQAREAARRGMTEPARLALVLRTIMGLRGRQSGACLAYIGGKSDGSSIDVLDGDLSPDQLDRALGVGCGAAPTVVIVSGCDTGAFAAPPMTRPNRLILTASKRGLSGFGCGPNLALTTFDECLIGGLDGAGTWVDVFERTKLCVARREQLVAQPPVEPQVYIGAAVQRLVTPIPSAAIVPEPSFRQGIGRFVADDAPYFSALKAKTRPAFEAYAHAALPKAMALTLAGTVTWASAEHGGTSEDVVTIALQRCEWESSGPCMLYARDLNLAAPSGGGVPAVHPPVLVRSGTLTAANTPFIRQDQRAEVTRYLALPEPKALALDPESETLGLGTGATSASARQAALEKCRMSGPRMNGQSCLVFAEADRIVLGYH